MAKPEAVFIYIGTYPDEAAARDDYNVVKDLHAAGAVGTYDAAVVTKDDKGKVHENKDEMATRHGAWDGAAVGAPPSDGRAGHRRCETPDQWLIGSRTPGRRRPLRARMSFHGAPADYR